MNSKSDLKRLSLFDDDFFDFRDRGRSGTYSLGENDNVAEETSVGTFKPRLENVDTTVDLRTNRPEAKP
ncbi:hypothetical protein AOLI_G00247850 [Acnodon oligacanthus]